jgi:hypothetical protein
MSDVAREKYQRVIDEIDDLEEQIEALAAAHAPTGEVRALNQRLEERMYELARLTDGCQKIHVKREG